MFTKAKPKKFFASPSVWGKAAAAAFSGPKDIVGSDAIAYYSTLSYSAAYAAPGTNPCVDLVDQAGANPITVAILSSGLVDDASIAAWVTAHSVTTIKVSKIYDQSPNGHHVSQATLSKMPVLVRSALNSLPVFRLDSANSQTLDDVVAAATLTPPLSYTVAAKSAGNASFCFLIGLDGGGSTTQGFGFDFGNPNLAFVADANASNVQTVTASDNSWHKFQTVNNGTTPNSFMTVDGSQTTFTLSNSAFTSAKVHLGSLDGASRFTSCDFVMIGVWNSAFSGGVPASLDSKMNAVWGI